MLDAQISAHSDGLHSTLAPLEPATATAVWFDTIRAVEEFINLPNELDDPKLVDALLTLPVVDVLSARGQLRVVCRHIADRYGDGFQARFSWLLSQGATMGLAFAENGDLVAAANFRTVATMATYLQSRRRHLVTLLYTIASVCRGSEVVDALDAFAVFLTPVEFSGIVLTGLYQQLMLSQAFGDYRVRVDANGFSGALEFPALETFFLEPERVSIFEMHTSEPNDAVVASLERVERDRVFSAAELRNNICLLEDAYKEFDLASTEFGTAAALVRDLSKLATDDYWVSLTPEDFTGLADSLNVALNLRSMFVHRGSDYVVNSNSYAPFIETAGVLRTTVTLLSRFLYYYKNVCLYKNRRFQIRSGYIFEEIVSDVLKTKGYALTDIKRVNNKEFDVVTVRDDMIVNLQCKNNVVDLTRLEANTKLFARYNRALEARYRRALRKEEGREQLLTKKLGLTKILHLVVTRFPIATQNPRILPFSLIDELDARVRSLAAQS